VDTPVVLDDNDRYLIHLLEYCYSDSRNLWTVMREGGLAP
jgi:hypothetical protein